MSIPSLTMNDGHTIPQIGLGVWQVPDDVVFVESIPLGATGKMQKMKLREQFRDHRLPAA